MSSSEFWTAVGAIGQWAGAIATLAAVIIALNADKPKVKFSFVEVASDYPNSPGMDAPNIGIYFYNEKNFTIIINRANFLVAKNRQWINCVFQTSFPQEIGSWSVLISPYNLSKGIESAGLSGEVKLYFVLVDSAGREYKKVFYFDTAKKRVVKKWCEKLLAKIGNYQQKFFDY